MVRRSESGSGSNQAVVLKIINLECAASLAWPDLKRIEHGQTTIGWQSLHKLCWAQWSPPASQFFVRELVYYDSNQHII